MLFPEKHAFNLPNEADFDLVAFFTETTPPEPSILVSQATFANACRAQGTSEPLMLGYRMVRDEYIPESK